MVTSLRHGAFVVALAASGACFVDPPPVTNDTETTDPCAMDQTACACMSGCVDSTSSSGSASEASTQPGPDSSTDAGSSGESLDTSSDDDSDATSEASSTTSQLDTGTTGPDESCKVMACAECITCVDGDGQACSAEFAACDAVNGCEAAVDCLVDCGLGIDCLDNCCKSLDQQQLAVVNQLVLCKSDECIDPCDMVAELDAC